jgi:hypothetical protein
MVNGDWKKMLQFCRESFSWLYYPHGEQFAVIVVLPLQRVMQACVERSFMAVLLMKGMTS